MSFEAYGQNETLVSSIRNIIKDYPFESIIKEFLQNADDAGATKFHVIVDERSHPSNYLLCNEMKDWQGPSILLYNNALFKESDFKSLMQIRVGGKQDDDTKIGKFGLGFNSCYHLTDLPSFISGNSIAFLDPQEKFLPRNSEGKGQHGIIGIIPTNGVNGYSGGRDQLVPYEGIEGLNFCSSYEGTLFRIPLRQKPSEISEDIFTTVQVLNLINNIKSDFSSQFLFLRNVETIEMSHIREDGVPPTLHPLWKATVTGLNGNVREQRKRVSDGVFQIFQLEIELIDNTNYKQKDQWIISTGAEQNPENPQMKKYAKKYRLRVLGGIAALLKSSKIENKNNFAGRLYSFFQLPDVSYLSFHLNGTWAQGSDRGRILIENDNIPDLDHQKLNWNRYILLEFLPKLYCKFLEGAIKLHKSKEIEFKNHPVVMFWPFSSSSRNYPKYAIEYSCKVLQHLFQNDDIFRLIDNDAFNENKKSRADILFKLFPENQNLESGIRTLLRTYRATMLSDSSIKSMLSSFPIWPIHEDPLQTRPPNSKTILKPASGAYVLPENLVHYRTKNDIIYLKPYDNHFDNIERQILYKLGVPTRDLSTYIFEDIDYPNEYNDHYTSFLYSVLKHFNNDNIIQGLRDKPFPTLSKKLKVIADLYDYNNTFFRNMFGEDSDIFLSDRLSDVSSVLSKIEFKNRIDRKIFVECAKKIENLQEVVDSPSDLRNRGFFLVDHLYKNISTLGLETLENVMRIPFVPVSKNLDKPYSLNYDHPVLDCFKNMILFKYKGVAWSKLALIAEDATPPKSVLQICPTLGKPNVPIVIDHLRFLHGTIQNNEWKNNWADTLKHNVYEVYKWLEEECTDGEISDEDSNLSNYIRPNEKLFLNFKRNQDPFDIDNWSSATNLILNSEPSEREYVNPSLAEYRNMLKSAGVREVKPPNVTMNVRTYEQSYINTMFEFLLNQEFPLHDITFIVNSVNHIKANQCIIAAKSNYFHQRFNPATIVINDIDPNSMRIVLRYLYGQNIDDAIQNRQSLINNDTNQTNQNNRNVQPSDLALYKDLLKLADQFVLEHLKELMELRLSRLVNRTNMEEMKRFAEISSASQLNNFCHHFILKNREL